MKHIVNLSGGKDSTCLLIEMLKRNMPIDYIVFTDTGKDFPQMLEHIEKLKIYLKQKYPTAPPITILKAEQTFDYLMFEHEKTRGKNKGKRGYGWATMICRWCTAQSQNLRSCQILLQDFRRFGGKVTSGLCRWRGLQTI